MTAFVDTIRTEKKSALTSVFAVLLGSLFLALMAQLSVPLWFSPVPISMQPFGVLVIGAFLGSKKGSFAVLTYLFEGAIGLPFFAGGACGIAKLFGPTGGYLVGFALAAFCVGFLIERGWKASILKSAIAMTLGMAIILSLGMVWLANFVGFSAAFKLGVLPFLLGSVIKIGLAVAITKSAWKIFKF